MSEKMRAGKIRDFLVEVKTPEGVELIKITSEDVDQIMSCALETECIYYWCHKVRPIEGHYMGRYVSEHLSYGGALKLFDAEEEDVTYFLNVSKLAWGIKKYIETGNKPYNILTEEKEGGFKQLDPSMIDGAVADIIVQYAAIGDYIYA